MPINYSKESKKYKPKKFLTLLVGEAPPPNGRDFFYIPKAMNNNRMIKGYRSLPATIFFHYFKQIPSTVDEYKKLLDKLKKKGIFLIDIVDKPTQIRNNAKGLAKVKREIKKLRSKMKLKKIIIGDEKIIFLLARTNYSDDIGELFPISKKYRWIDFRLRRCDCHERRNRN